ncbi:MAG: putative Ig domain-containing protein [bacterium]|nr:putative Ig domain-containing protein [bacterium]
MKRFKRRLAQFLAAALVVSSLSPSGMTAFAQTAQTETENIVVATSSNALEIGSPSDAVEIAPTSLLPLREVRGYLMLNAYSEEELKAMPLETLLGLLKDEDGNPIEIPEDAEVVWTYFKDEDGNRLYEEYHMIGRDETVDVSAMSSRTTRYTMEMIVGTGTQLNPDNIRYIITTYVNALDEYISYDLKREDEEGDLIRVPRQDMIYGETVFASDINIPIKYVNYITYDHEEGNQYYLSIRSELEGSQIFNLNVDVYPMKQFLKYYRDGEELSGAITEQMLIPSKGSSSSMKGYLGKYEKAESEESDNVFCLVYTDKTSKEIVSYQGFVFNVMQDTSAFEIPVFAYENGEMTDITEDYDVSMGNSSWRIQLGEMERYTQNSFYIEYVYLKKNYKVKDGSCYYVMDDTAGIEKVVSQYANTLEEVTEENDITEQICPADRSTAPYGYKVENRNYNHLTIFYKNGMVRHVALRVIENLSGGDGSGLYETEYDAAPTVKDVDPYFRVLGLEGEKNYDVYLVENDSDKTLDTIYGFGYQTVMILDDEVDLSKLKPTFWKPDDVKVHSGNEQISGVSEQDFSEGPVYYQVHIGENLKNYQVTFVKREHGPKLFVNGPDEREIFLNEYFENRHDILIANIGDEELTGLKVELLDAVNVKLDDYWVVGGENNDTLAAFEEVYSGSSYGELANLAKIRLLPDGEGDVSGTVKISADGQEDVFIKLTGKAGNPSIITEKLDDAVKYVPYSYMVATNNMHDWNQVGFEVVEGKLPEGLELYYNTGEIYGVPTESGEFPIKVMAEYSREEFEPSYAEFTLTVKRNSNTNVYLASDEGYHIETPVGRLTSEGSYEYSLSNTNDQLFVSVGQFREFEGFWLNGEKLVDGEDYTKDEGSTRITIKSQTLKNKAVRGTNTIAAEFRVDGQREKELKRTAQNFMLKKSSGGSSSGGSSSGGSGSSSKVPPTVIDTTKTQSQTSQEEVFTDNSWVQDSIGWWCKKQDGTWLANTWKQLPYQGTIEWYYFRNDGYMVTGWQKVEDRWYYLHAIPDGTGGRMYTGWHLIDGKWYYFNEVSDGTKGALMTDTWVGEYYVDKDGVWAEQ